MEKAKVPPNEQLREIVESGALLPLGKNVTVESLHAVIFLGARNLKVAMDYWRAEEEYFSKQYVRVEDVRHLVWALPLGGGIDQEAIEQTMMALKQRIGNCKRRQDLLRDLHKKAEITSPVFPWLRRADHFTEGHEVICYLYPGCDVDAELMHTFVHGRVISSYQLNVGEVTVEMSAQMRKDDVYPDSRLIYKITDPAVMLKEEAVALQQHPDFFEFWLRWHHFQPDRMKEVFLNQKNAFKDNLY